MTSIENQTERDPLMNIGRIINGQWRQQLQQPEGVNRAQLIQDIVDVIASETKGTEALLAAQGK